MDAFKCDRCGGYYDERGEYELVVGKRSSRGLAISDLCPDCQSDLMDFMNGAITCASVKVNENSKIGF